MPTYRYMKKNVYDIVMNTRKQRPENYYVAIHLSEPSSHIRNKGNIKHINYILHQPLYSITIAEKDKNNVLCLKQCRFRLVY